MSYEKKKRLDLKKKNNALIIFVKNLEKGKVKTRIAEEAGDDYALKVYLELQAHTRSEASKLSVSRYLYYSSRIDLHDLWDNEEYIKDLQEGDTLGDRMHNAFTSVLYNHDKAIIIGSDCIQLDHQLLERAFHMLDVYDTVIGPAIDGGYYLLGLKKSMIQLFQNIAWSTDAVFNTTLARIISSGENVHILPELNDIDYLEDWKKYGYEI
jgi:rSAM/selenodomain-associated transferase 1